MGIGCHGHARDLGTDVGAPRIGKRQEKLLAIGPAVGALVVERLALLFQADLRGAGGQMDAAVVGSVLSLGQQTVLLYAGAGFRHVLRIFVRNAFAAFVVVLGVRFVPPVAQIAVGVELASLIVEAVNDLVSDDHADGAVVHSII